MYYTIKEFGSKCTMDDKARFQKVMSILWERDYNSIKRSKGGKFEKSTMVELNGMYVYEVYYYIIWNGSRGSLHVLINGDSAVYGEVIA